MAVRETDNVLDPTVLEGLAVIAAANGRSVEEELNIAVKTYVVSILSDRNREAFVKLVPSEATSGGRR